MGNPKKNTSTLILLHLAVFLSGWTGIFGRLISLGGLPLVWYRMIVSVVVLLLVMALMHRLHKISQENFLALVGCGGILALHWAAFFASIQESNVSIGVACVVTSCFFTTLFDPLFNQKRLSWIEVLISFISIAGVLLIFILEARFRLGISLGILSATLYSVFSLMNTKVAKDTGEESDTILLYELLGGVVFLTICMPLLAQLLPSEPLVPVQSDYLWLFLLGSVFTVLPFLFQLKALTRQSASTVNLAYNLKPVYSIVFAAILFHEHREVNLSFWLGISLIVISVLIQTYRARKATRKVQA